MIKRGRTREPEPKRFSIGQVVRRCIGTFIAGMGVALVCLAFISRVENLRKIEDAGRRPPPRAGIALRSGAMLTPTEQRIGDMMIADPRLKAALAYLDRSGGFKAGIRLDANACWLGVDRFGTHFDKRTHDVAYCLYPFDAWHGTLVSAHEDADRITRDAALFVLFHEIAHAFIFDRHVPVLGREEDVADEMAVHIALHVHAASVVDSGARYLAAKLGGDGGYSDEHVDPGRRAYRVRCLLAGSAPKHFAKWLADNAAFSASDVCTDLYTSHAGSWNAILGASAARSKHALRVMQHKGRYVAQPAEM